MSIEQVITCNRCKTDQKFSNPLHISNWIRVKWWRNSGQQNTTNTRDFGKAEREGFDLCPECAMGLKKFVDTNPNVNEIAS